MNNAPALLQRNNGRIVQRVLGCGILIVCYDFTLGQCDTRKWCLRQPLLTVQCFLGRQLYFGEGVGVERRCACEVDVLLKIRRASGECLGAACR